MSRAVLLGGAVLLAGLLGTGCTPVGQACTEIAAPTGVGVTVTPPLAEQIRLLTLHVCWSGSCRDLPVTLESGSDPVDPSCSDEGPDGTCSATASPNGTRTAFVEVADLPDQGLTVGASLRSTAGDRELGPVPVEVQTVQPNGPGCPGTGRQARVTIGADGIH